MKHHFDEAAEERYREEFIGGRGIRRVDHHRSHIRRSCLTFRDLFPDDSILNHTHSTAWVTPWLGHRGMRSVATRTRTDHLRSLYAWWTWLLERHVIDDNVLEFGNRPLPTGCKRLFA